MAIYSAFAGAIGVALVLTILFVLLGSRGPWGSIWALFLVLFLALWATALFVNPIGPAFWGIPWIPIIFAGILFAVLLFAVMPDAGRSRKHLGKKKPGQIPDSEVNDVDLETSVAVIGGFFWLLILLFIIAIIVGLTVKVY
jgi:hypothetical protein